MGGYDIDFHAWAFVQAHALRRRAANEIDWEHVAEELESLGRSERNRLRSHSASCRPTCSSGSSSPTIA